MPPKTNSKAKKYCAFHDSWDLGHSTHECYARAASQNGKTVQEKTCRLCGKPGHVLNDCPDLGICTDRDKNGKPKKRRMCFNCGTDECGADCPKNCRYHPSAAWRINTNTSRFFKAIKEGHDFVPIYPPLSSLKLGETPFPIHKDDSPSTPRKTQEPTPQPHWVLYVSGCEWTTDRLSKVTTFVKDKAEMEVKESMLVIQCQSEGDAQELMAQFQQVTFPDGEKLHVTREHVIPTPPTTPSPSLTTTPLPKTTSGISTIQVTELIDKRMGTVMEKHTHAINENFKVINSSIQKIAQRQDAAEKRADSQQDLLIIINNNKLASMFAEMQAWRKHDGREAITPNTKGHHGTAPHAPPTTTPRATNAVSDLQGGTPEAPMDVDAAAASSSTNTIPSPPPEASPLALQRALKKKSPVEVPTSKPDTVRLKPGARALKTALKKRQLPARRCVKTSRASLEDLSTPVKEAIAKDTDDLPRQLKGQALSPDDSVVQTLDELLASAADSPPTEKRPDAPPPCHPTQHVMTTEPGTHVYCINPHAKNVPFAKMVVIQTLNVGCSVLGRGAEPPQFWVLLIFLYLPGYGGGSEATGAFFFLNTYGGFLRWRIWATYSFFSIQHAFIDFECFCAFLCKV